MTERVVHYGANGFGECGAGSDDDPALRGRALVTKLPADVTCPTCRGWLPLVAPELQKPRPIPTPLDINDVLDDVLVEVTRACVKFAPFNSAHEGYAVILEELDELWDEIKKKQRDRVPIQMETEAVQVAAMAVRFVLNVCRSSPRSAPAVREDVDPPIVPLRETDSSSSFDHSDR